MSWGANDLGFASQTVSNHSPLVCSNRVDITTVLLSVIPPWHCITAIPFSNSGNLAASTTLDSVA